MTLLRDKAVWMRVRTITIYDNNILSSFNFHFPHDVYFYFFNMYL